MIRALSYVIAVIITLLLVCLLYPVACLFWVLGALGRIVGGISDWIFVHANNTIRNLWAELRNSPNDSPNNSSNDDILQ